MKVADLIAAMERIAPTYLAEGWDNVGLIVGSVERVIDGPLLLTIDLTPPVLAEAICLKARAIVAYHPPLFHPLKRLTDGPGSSQTERVLLGAIGAGIAVYSPHTALDAVDGGVTDWLADGVLETRGASHAGTGLPAGGPSAGGDRRAIKPLAERQSIDEVKVVTFVPLEALERVRSAMASAGAGLIGAYEVCSFTVEGEGTFMGREGTRPSVGEVGKLESVRERRLEMVCAKRSLALVLETLRQFHPYEEPAIDVYPLEPKPLRSVGVGRRIMLDKGTTLLDLGERIKRHIGAPSVQIAPASGIDAKTSVIQRVGLVPGAGASIVQAAIGHGCQVFVTGEMKHHEVLAATGAGVSVILGGHTRTERGYLPLLMKRLETELEGAKVVVSTRDVDPLMQL